MRGVIYYGGGISMKFDKYVAAGNDFVIFNGIENSYEDISKLALKVCHRRFGIGADGIMICEASDLADIKMIYYNSDGSQGEMCGNGIRCFSKYIYDYGIMNKKDFSVETLAGIKYISIQTDLSNRAELIKVDMGYPKDEIIDEVLIIDGESYNYSSLLVGVPHVVIFVEDIKDININDLGIKMEVDPLFPQKTNVNFIEVIDQNNINIYTWERGAGRTLGCGTGSCAAVVIGRKLNLLNSKVHVNTEGGNLDVELSPDYRIYMSGSATHIASGTILEI